MTRPGQRGLHLITPQDYSSSPLFVGCPKDMPLKHCSMFCFPLSAIRSTPLHVEESQAVRQGAVDAVE